MVENQFLNIGDVADWKINKALEYFRYMGTLQLTTIFVYCYF